jgi:hypothetical protein
VLTLWIFHTLLELPIKNVSGFIALVPVVVSRLLDTDGNLLGSIDCFGIAPDVASVGVARVITETCGCAT